MTSAPHGIRIIKNGQLLAEPFLDLSSQVVFQGVGSMAFHPDFAQNGRFFVVQFEHGFINRLVEYRVDFADPDRADPSSAITLLGPEPQAIETHCWNHLQFGPDGMLYMSTGDGLLADPARNPAQDLGVLAGKILRLDVDGPAPYIPIDNPFLGVPGARPEVWAYGLRNPWRFHIDAASELLYIADVGDIGLVAHEELNVLPLAMARGANFGWKCREGTLCRNFQGCPFDCVIGVAPAFEFTHAGGRCAIIGGQTYRGPLPYLAGTHFFAEWCSATIWTTTWDGTQLTPPVDRSAELAPGLGQRIDLPNAFGSDAAGNMYVLDNVGGEVYRIDEVCGPITSTCVRSLNSSGFDGALSAVGSPSLTTNSLRLVAQGLPANTSGTFFYGFAPILAPLGNGVLCIAPPLYRLQGVVQANAQGRGEFDLDLQELSNPSRPGAVAPGTTAYFQLWFRDPAGGGAASNTTDALLVPFCL